MIADLDESLRRLLIRELPIQNDEVDIQFNQPKREWSAHVSRPTLNIFLYDVRENQKLRQTQPMWETDRNPDGTTYQRRKPIRLDLHYLVTVWAIEPEDEHRLLTRTLMALFRFPNLPDDLLVESLLVQNKQIPMNVAQYTEINNTTDFWTVLDNEMRPAVVLVITVSLDPYTPIAVPLVRAREVTIGPSSVPLARQLDRGGEPDRFWTIGGEVRSRKPLDYTEVQLTLVETAMKVPVRSDGRFSIGNLRAGPYTLEYSGGTSPIHRCTITVPSSDFILEL
jgi:hypothetical protein